jgi:hypothetical protein
VDRKVIRDWRGERRITVEVSTEHPQYGNLLRGWIEPAKSSDWRCAWWIRTCDHDVVGDAVFVGNYLDAERALLDATPGLDD